LKNNEQLRVYEVRLGKVYRGVDLISDALPFGRLCYGEPSAIKNAIYYGSVQTPLSDADAFGLSSRVREDLAKLPGITTHPSRLSDACDVFGCCDSSDSCDCFDCFSVSYRSLIARPPIQSDLSLAG
jgi:hypothetical protein